MIRRQFPDKPLIIAADDDLAVMREYGHNPGRDKAEEAAQAVGGQAIFPIFAPGEQPENPKAFSDFNDLAVKSSLGAEAVERQLKAFVRGVLKHQHEVEQSEVLQAMTQRRSARR